MVLLRLINTRAVLVKLFCACAILFMGAAQAQLRLGETAYFYDASNHLSLEDVQNQSFTPYFGIFSKGYKEGSFWLRFQLLPDEKHTSNATNDMALTIQPPYLDEVMLFEAATDRVHLPIGQRYAWRNNELPGLALGFSISGEPVPRTLYLRVKTGTTYIVDTQLQSSDKAVESRLKHDFLLHTLTVALMLLFFISLIYLLMVRTQIMGIFVFKQGMALLYGASLLGYHRLFLSDVIDPVWIAAFTKWAIVLYAWSSTHFHRHFFRTYAPSRVFMIGVEFFWWLSLIGAVLLLFGQVGWALLVTKITAISGPVWMVILVHKGIDWEQISSENKLLRKPTVMLVHWVMMIFLLLAAIPTLGFGLSGVMTLYASLLHGVFTGIILLVMVHRQQIMTSQHHLKQVMHAQTELALERTHRERQSQFMAMLTHELRTPLSVLRLALPKANEPTQNRVKELATQAIDDMYTLIDHCNQLDRIDQAKLPVKIENVCMSTLMNEVSTRFSMRANLHIICDLNTTVKCDRILLATVLNNLIDNAIKYGLSGQPIHIQVFESSEHAIQLSVTNNLPPNVKPDHQKIFDKFYRDPSARRTSGTGLGLYIVRALCGLMQGRVWVRMPDEQSITLWLELPRAITAPP
jgi:two-component system, sensor histidine kinase LadS